MIVFKYFYEKMDIFAPLIDKKMHEENKEEEEDSSNDESKDEEVVKPSVAALCNFLTLLVH